MCQVSVRRAALAWGLCLGLRLFLCIKFSYACALMACHSSLNVLSHLSIFPPH